MTDLQTGALLEAKDAEIARLKALVAELEARNIELRAQLTMYRRSRMSE